MAEGPYQRRKGDEAKNIHHGVSRDDSEHGVNQKEEDRERSKEIKEERRNQNSAVGSPNAQPNWGRGRSIATAWSSASPG
jgi:hypothetical protein